MYTIQGARKKLETFKLFPDGWDFGQGKPVSHYIALQAHDVLDAGCKLGIEEADVFPGLEGDVEVHLYYQKHSFEFLIDKDGVMYTHENQDITESRLVGISFYTALQEFERTALQVCGYLESSTRRDMPLGKKDFRLLPSAVTATREGYPLWMSNVLFAPV